MRRLVVSVGVAFGLVLIGAGSALAAPAPEASAAQEAVPGKKVCKVTDERLDELSGIVATDDGFIVINDSTQQNSRKRVFFLDTECKVVETVAFSGNGPRDTEDLVLSADGKTLWIADIGDNRKERSTVGLWTMPADGSEKPKIHRLAYPDGAHDAEAMLLNGDGTPIIVTKEVSKPAGVYVPTAALKTENTEGVPMKRAGEITVPPSNTPSNALARLGKGTIDGGAVASGGGKVALRTYTDALEWSVSGGDVVAALTGKPRVTPLPDEPQGEAITYSADGKYFYTVSDMQGNPDDADNYLLQYTPVAKAAVAKSAAGGEGAGADGASWFDNLTINDITYLVGGVGVIGAILVGFGIFGIMRARKRPPAAPVGKGGGPHGPKPTDAQTELLAVGGAASGPGVYGGGPGVYGAKPAPQKGGVYGAGGGRPPQGGQPGRPGGGRPGQGAGQPGRSGGVQPGRSGGVPPGRPGPGGQPVGRPGGGRPAPGGQPAGRPAPPPPGRSGGQPSGRPGQGGQPGGGGVYGAPPARPQGQPPRGNSGGSGQRGNDGGSSSPRPSGFFGQGAGHQGGGYQSGGGHQSGGRQGGGYQGGGRPESGRPAATDYSRDRNYDYPGYSR